MYTVMHLSESDQANLPEFLKRNGLILSSNFLVHKDGTEEVFGMKINKARHILNMSTIINSKGETVNDFIRPEVKTAKYT